MLTQLNPPIPVSTPKGSAWAIGIIDYGPHWNLQWVTFIKETGECWTFLNPQIRQEGNYTFGLPKPAMTEEKNDVAAKKPVMRSRLETVV
jgi:hypothetical protein